MTVESQAHVPLLSARERQIVSLVAEGKTNKEIAKDLGLASATIKTHLQRIATKVGDGSRSAIVAYCMREGIIQ